MYRTTPSGTIYPLDMTKYYIYTLSKPCGEVFYIGKGLRGRVNHHFQKNSLRGSTHKNNIIKKYGSQIVRQIVAYFSDEDKAYEFEELAISEYGLIEDGGTLANKARTRTEYSETHRRASIEGSRTRVRKFSDDQIIQLYYDYFENNLARSTIYRNLNMSEGYFHSIVTGSKCKKLYAKYVQSGRILDKRLTQGVRATRRLSDLEIIEGRFFEQYYESGKSGVDLSEGIFSRGSTLLNILKGNTRAYLLEDYQKVCPDFGSGRVKRFPDELEDAYATMLKLYAAGKPLVKICEDLKLNICTVRARIKKYEGALHGA